MAPVTLSSLVDSLCHKKQNKYTGLTKQKPLHRCDRGRKYDLRPNFLIDFIFVLLQVAIFRSDCLGYNLPISPIVLLSHVVVPILRLW